MKKLLGSPQYDEQQYQVKSMKRIIAQVAANNQLTIRYVSRPSCLKGKQEGDMTSQKRQERIAWMQKQREEIDRILLHACDVYTHVNTVFADMSLLPTIHFSEEDIISRGGIIQHVAGGACVIPDVVTYASETGEGMTIVTESYEEICQRKRCCLDIIKKSQHSKIYERPWGKPQTIKRFTRNAKQRILECGAVVDSECALKEIYELTLTIPGSGLDVYRVVSEWSGYIVNRMTQIIRRKRWERYNPYWFFVWEHQKRGALHMHWCVAIKGDNMAARRLCMELKDKWYVLLMELSDKTRIDLFKKKGSFGTWRHDSQVWQWHCKTVTKSVAAYFSKYCSKTYETSQFNAERRRRRERHNGGDSGGRGKQGIVSLCPSRYWGCSSSLKKLCADKRITISFDVVDSETGDRCSQAIAKWCAQVSTVISQVSRRFERADVETGFIYARGWESKAWFRVDSFGEVTRLFQYIRENRRYLKDPIGGLLRLHEMYLHACDTK